MRGAENSLVICDPKSELYEKTSAYLRDQGYTVRVFNLVTPASSDSWNCLSEIDGQELMAQLFCDVIIRNTGSDRGDHFWDSAEMNLLKALVLFVERSYPPERRNIGEAYQLLVSCSEKGLGCLTRSRWGIRPERRTASSGNRRRACAAASLSVSAPGCRCSRTQIFAPSPAIMRSIWSCRASSRALITASRAIRTVPSISCPRCFCRSFLSNSSATPTRTVRAAVCRFLFMCSARSFAPAALSRTSAEKSP